MARKRSPEDVADEVHAAVMELRKKRRCECSEGCNEPIPSRHELRANSWKFKRLRRCVISSACYCSDAAIFWEYFFAHGEFIDAVIDELLIPGKYNDDVDARVRWVMSDALGVDFVDATIVIAPAPENSNMLYTYVKAFVGAVRNAAKNMPREQQMKSGAVHYVLQERRTLVCDCDLCFETAHTSGWCRLRDGGVLLYKEDQPYDAQCVFAAAVEARWIFKNMRATGNMRVTVYHDDESTSVLALDEANMHKKRWTLFLLMYVYQRAYEYELGDDDVWCEQQRELRYFAPELLEYVLGLAEGSIPETFPQELRLLAEEVERSGPVLTDYQFLPSAHTFKF
jgi:hypothetical protein